MASISTASSPHGLKKLKEKKEKDFAPSAYPLEVKALAG
jgi:hypothetical protein